MTKYFLKNIGNNNNNNRNCRNNTAKIQKKPPFFNCPVRTEKSHYPNSLNSPMVPEVTPTLTQNSLVVVMNLLVANTTRVDGRGIGVLRIEYHGLVFRVNL